MAELSSLLAPGGRGSLPGSADGFQIVNQVDDPVSRYATEQCLDRHCRIISTVKVTYCSSPNWRRWPPMRRIQTQMAGCLRISFCRGAAAACPSRAATAACPRGLAAPSVLPSSRLIAAGRRPVFHLAVWHRDRLVVAFAHHHRWAASPHRGPGLPCCRCCARQNGFPGLKVGVCYEHALGSWSGQQELFAGSYPAPLRSYPSRAHRRFMG